MDTVKHQHYVPQFYLKEFADENEQIWVYDKVLDRSFLTSVRNVAGERYFYDSNAMEAAVGDRQAIEKYLSRLEGEFSDKISRLLRRLRTDSFARIHPETRGIIAIFAAFQLIRTKEHRITSLQTAQQIKKFLLKHSKTESMLAELEAGMTKEGMRELHSQQILNIPKIVESAQILKSHIWVIGKRHLASSFYAGDEPITKKANIRIPFRGNDGIACKGIEVHLPLAHDYCITMYEKSYFSDVAKFDGKVMPLLSNENMVYLRQFPVKYSSRFVFCREDDFDLARQICREEPHWRDPDRKRITSNHDDDFPDV